jgi:hypothetical protein
MPDPAQRRSGLLQVLRDHPAVRLAGTTHGSNYAESGQAAGRRILAEEPGERACDRLLEPEFRIIPGSRGSGRESSQVSGAIPGYAAGNL